MYHLDLHVHTSRYSPCAEMLKPELLPQKMRDTGLHGLVLTEHNILWNEDELLDIGRGSPELRLFRGVELSCGAYHFVVIGLDSLNGIRPGCSPERLLEKAEEQQAAVILAHHHLTYSTKPKSRGSLALPEGIDAIEVYSTMTRGRHSREAFKLAEQNGWQKVAGSDAHAIENVGRCYTVVETWPDDEKFLANLVRTGQCTPAADFAETAINGIAGKDD